MTLVIPDKPEPNPRANGGMPPPGGIIGPGVIGPGVPGRLGMPRKRELGIAMLWMTCTLTTEGLTCV